MRIILALAFLSFLLLTGCKKDAEKITQNDIRYAQKLIGLQFSPDKIDTLTPYLNRNLAGYDSMRQHVLPDNLFPALLFNPRPSGFKISSSEDLLIFTAYESSTLPDLMDSLCFFPLAKISYLLRSRKLTSVQLTELYLKRIKEFDKTLKSVITLTEDLALEEARQADQEMDEGLYRGPLHGVPYGLKDLVAASGFPTTWGAQPYKNQTVDYDATIVTKLREAGAILLGKLSSGALARGDVWFGGRTVSPWDTLIGASGSSAGSAAATAAGLVAFSIGTETLGSITSPSARNGLTGLRPSYGTVSRFGVMSLSWSMDKIGPICRTAEDCALVFAALKGRDSLDITTVEFPLSYQHSRSLADFSIGVLQTAVDVDTSTGAGNLKSILSMLDSLGITMTEKKLPTQFPFKVFDIILRAESGAFFDQLVRSGGVDQMVQQDKTSRANSLRQSRFIPAVEYLQANRYRALLIDSMFQLMQDIDVLIAPNSAENQLLITNLTGQPALSIPTGLDSLDHPTSLTLIGKLYEEGTLLEIGHALQRETNFHKLVPPLFKPGKKEIN
ncbi:MAG: amidase [Saprospiraceae bacterium]|nr:amidase [Saprospiraceae bacterium]